MKRSEINALIKRATACFELNGWTLPPKPKWDVTDFGLGDHTKDGLVLVNLSEEPEYCEKLMYAACGMTTPMHRHKFKKEDIICRSGELCLEVTSDPTLAPHTAPPIELKINGSSTTLESGSKLNLRAGERVTLAPGVWHSFWPLSDECVIGEVSTANNDRDDNVFHDPGVGRFPTIEEDEPAFVRLLHENP